ncbi:hypothetical protein D3C87_1098620 [compost metagenome]
MAEVEAQALTVDQRAFLLNVIAQHLAQCSVQQVSRGVVQRRGVTHLGVNVGLDRRTDDQATRIQDTVVQECTAGLGGVTHVETRAARLQVTAIADLATGLGVERRLVENDHALIAFAQYVD